MIKKLSLTANQLKIIAIIAMLFDHTVAVFVAHNSIEGYDTEEGCLSLLGGPRKCKRYKKIKVQYQTLEMQTRVKTYEGWTAQIIQHEVDHCNGVLI